MGDATPSSWSACQLDFLDFFWWREGRAVWIVQRSSSSTVIFYWVLRQRRDRLSLRPALNVEDRFPGFLLIFMIVLLILASFIPEKPAITNGLICVALFAVGLLRDLARGGGLKKTWKTVLDIDFFTLFLLMGLFVVVGGLTQAGVIERFAAFIARTGQGNVFFVLHRIVWMSVLISAFVTISPMWPPCWPVVGRCIHHVRGANLSTLASCAVLPLGGTSRHRASATSPGSAFT